MPLLFLGANRHGFVVTESPAIRSYSCRQILGSQRFYTNTTTIGASNQRTQLFSTSHQSPVTNQNLLQAKKI